MATKKEMSLTGIMIHDEVYDRYTAYFAEFPEAIAEGKDEKEAIENLMEAFKTILEFKKEEAQSEAIPDSRMSTKSFNLALS